MNTVKNMNREGGGSREEGVVSREEELGRRE